MAYRGNSPSGGPAWARSPQAAYPVPVRPGAPTVRAPRPSQPPRIGPAALSPRTGRSDRLPPCATLLATLLAVRACSSGTGEVGRQGSAAAAQASATVRQPLQKEALRALLSNAYVEPVRPADGSIVSNWPGEVFKSDGIYVRLRNRSRLFGTYEIKGNSVCVRGKQIKRQCRRVIQNVKNTYSSVDTDDAAQVVVSIRPH